MSGPRSKGPVEASLGPRIAQVIHESRSALGWTQEELGDRANVSQAQVSRIECGWAGHGRVDEAARILDALGVRADLVLRAPVLIGAPSQQDAAHARVLAYEVRRAGLAVEREVPIGADRVRGWIDLLAWHEPRRTLVVVEVKGDMDDVGSLERQVRWYEREAPWAARRLGWRPERVVTIAALLATDHNVRVVRANRELLGEGFPWSPTAAAGLLRGDPQPDGPMRALVFVDPARRGPAWMLPTPLGPGRPVVPYLDARAFVEARRRTRTTRV
jgi:transcriptional regulator with XRE-family HTH domain